MQDDGEDALAEFYEDIRDKIEEIKDMGQEIHEDTVPEALGIYLGVIEKEEEDSDEDNSDGSGAMSDWSDSMSY